MGFFARFRLTRLPLRDLLTVPPDDARIQVEGAAVPAADGPLAAPLTQRSCVYWRLAFEIYKTGARVDLTTERRVAFAVEVGANRRILVNPANIEIDCPDDTLQVADRAIGESYRVPAAVREAIEAQGVALAHDREITGIFAREEVIAVGERVRVAGRVRHRSIEAPALVRAMTPRPGNLVAGPLRGGQARTLR